MNQSTTILVGPNAGAKFYGAGSLRQARSAAKNRGRRFITKFVLNGTVGYGVWSEDGTLVASY